MSRILPTGTPEEPHLTGNNTLPDISGGDLVFSGDGTLNAGRISLSKLTIKSGTYNLEGPGNSDRSGTVIDTESFNMNGGILNIKSSESDEGEIAICGYFGKGEDAEEYTDQWFNFLGGTVNISGNFSCAINSGSENIKVSNATININQKGTYCQQGLSCGNYYEELNKYYGGELQLENADITINATDFSSDGYETVSFSSLNDLSNNHSYYAGTQNKPEKLSFDKAFTASKKRYVRKLDSSAANRDNYFRITTKDLTGEQKNTFSDVTDTTHPYYSAIYWASGKGITTGFSDGTFKPYDNCTRGQVVTFLWRLAGKPEPSSSAKAKFSDMVDSSHPYYKAILWAVEKGITTGFSDGTFKPFDNCSRGQIVTFIYRYAGKPSVSGKTANFKDMVSSGHPFCNPIVWASTNGITTGFSDNTFGPAQKCTRGQVVTFLYRYSSK